MAKNGFSPILSNAKDEASFADTAGPKEPTPKKKVRETAQMAHRDNVHKWVRGEMSTHKVKQSHARMKRVMKGEHD